MGNKQHTTTEIIKWCECKDDRLEIQALFWYVVPCDNHTEAYELWRSLPSGTKIKFTYDKKSKEIVSDIEIQN